MRFAPPGGKVRFASPSLAFSDFVLLFFFVYRTDVPVPKGPKIEKIQDRPPGLKISSGIEIFKRATRQTPIFCGES